MLLLRVAIAVAHGAYFGVAMVVAVGLVRQDQRGMAVALILAGLTVSGIVGVPIGTAIGNVWGWRATFWAMFVLGIVATLAMAALLPRGTGASAVAAGFRNEVRVLGRQQVWTCLIIMLMLMLCQFVPYTYIAPLLQEVTGLDAGLVPWVLLLNGLGATAGVFIGGKLAGRHLMPSLIAMLALQAVVLARDLRRQPLPAADGRSAHRLGRDQLRHRHADPDAHPRLDGRRAQPRFLADPVRLQCRHRDCRLGRRHDAQCRLSLPQPAAGRRRIDDRSCDRRGSIPCLGETQRRDPAAAGGKPAAGLASDHRQAARPPSRKRLVDPVDVGSGEPEVAGRRIVRGVLGARRLRDGEHRRPPRQEGQRHLSRRRAMRIGYLLQHAAAGRRRAREPVRGRTGCRPTTATSCFSHQGTTACSMARSSR